MIIIFIGTTDLYDPSLKIIVNYDFGTYWMKKKCNLYSKQTPFMIS